MKLSATADMIRPVQASAMPMTGVRFRAGAPSGDSLSIRFGNTQAVGRNPDHLADIRSRGAVVVGGGGTMGADIALTILNGNIPVYLQDRNEEALASGEEKISKGLLGAVARGLVEYQEAEKRQHLLKGKFTDATQIPTAPAPAIVIEAVFESYGVKEDVFRKLNAHLPADTILATNTSSLSVERLAEASGRPDRFVGLHYFLPAYKNRLVEIIPGSKTSAETIERTKALVKATGRVPIVCKDSPGFGVNRMLVPVMNEGIKLWERMVADQKRHYAEVHGEQPSPAVVERMERRAATTIERAVHETLWPNFSKNPEAQGMLIGPFSGLNSEIYMGIVGDITQSLYQGLGEGYRPADTVTQKSQAFYALRKERPANYAERFAQLQYKLGGPESIDQAALPAIKEHLLGLIIGVAMQLIDQGVISPEDLQRGVGVGTKWELMPFDEVNRLGAKKALALVEKYAATNPAFQVPQTLRQLAATDGKVNLNYVDTRREGATQYITINKPQRKNALDQAALENIRRVFRAAQADPAVKTIVFESAGGGEFVSGADIFALQDQFRGMSPVQQLAVFRSLIMQGASLYDEIAHSPKVTVAKVNGKALGGGTELALACDYVVATENASFGTPEVVYGIYPAWGGTERLPQKIGPTMARFMILEGGVMNRGKGPAILNGADAARVGLADKLVHSDNLDREVQEAIARGEFSVKPERNSAKAEARTRQRLMAAPASGELAQESLQAKFERYSTASVDDLLDHELATLAPPSARDVYKKVLSLADGRIRHADSRLGARVRQERDIVRASLNYLAVQKLKKSQKKA